MSTRAITWAMEQQGISSSAKFVLVAIAQYANEWNEAYRCSAALRADTCQDRKTVTANIQRLIDAGFLVDTGKRVGRTKQMIVYRLMLADAARVLAVSGKSPEIGTLSVDEGAEDAVSLNSIENGPISSPETIEIVPKTGLLNGAENGPVENGKRPKFPPKEAQISPERGPKTGPVYKDINNNQSNTPLTSPPRGGGDAKGVRMPNDWGLDADSATGMTAEVIEAARALKAELGVDWGANRLKFELDEFRDFWLAAWGANARKCDWLAAWRNRLRVRMTEKPGNDPVRRDRQAAAARDAQRGVAA